jgi:hypothetical protein
MEARSLHDIAAAHEVRRLKDVNVTFDVGRDVVGDPRRIVGHEQAYRDIFAIEPLGEGQG